MRHVVLYVTLQVAEQGHDPLDTSLDGQGDTLDHVVHEAAELLGVRLGQPEHVGDDAHGDVLGVLLGGVDHIASEEPFDELLAVHPCGRLQLVDHLGREDGQQQPAGLLVERRVGGDGRGDTLRGQRHRGPELGHEHAARGEPLGVVGDGGDVVVAGRQPHAPVPVAVGHRARPAELVPDRVRVRRPRVVGVVEVGGPVGDRLVVAHQIVSSMLIACSGQLATARRVLPSSSSGTVPSPASRPLPSSSGMKTSGAVA